MSPLGNVNWEKWKKKKGFNYAEASEGETIPLSGGKFADLKFRMTNMTTRDVECYNHPQGLSFGFRLHPPHLFDLRDGIIYAKKGGKWVKWSPDFAKNLTRFRKV